MFDMSQVMILDGGQSRSITGENKKEKKVPEGRHQENWEKEERFTVYISSDRRNDSTGRY